MKRRRQPPSPRLKRRYNIVHRLRLQGVSVDTVGNAINIATDKEYAALSDLAKKYVDALRTEYRYVIQTYIPCPPAVHPMPAVKFHRKKAQP